MKELVFESLVELCEKLKSGKVSSLELTQMYIDRIQNLNGSLNIVIRQHFSSALTRANELDKHLKSTGATIGPLHGVPFTIKDAFRIKGCPTSFGFPGFQYLPAFDSCQVVERLIAAGAVLLGQTNVPLSCFDWQTNSPIYGLTRNPLDREKTPGGSSGGSAASVAAFFSPFEVGSDLAGSIRYPAHCCGLYGLRPTHGMVPFADVGPSVHKESFKNLAVAGPIARSIDDLKIVLSTLTQQLDTSRVKAKLKIAYSLEWSGISTNESTKKRILSFVEKTRVSNHVLDPVDLQIDFERCSQVWGTIVGHEYKQMIPMPIRLRPAIDIFNYFFNTRRFREGSFKESFQEGLFSSKKKYRDALKEAKELRGRFFENLKDFDLWITPVSAAEAISHQPTGTEQTLNSKKLPYSSYIGNFLTPTTLFQHPILVAPLESTKSEFPIGIQLHGKPNQDWQLLSDCATIISGDRRILSL